MLLHTLQNTSSLFMYIFNMWIDMIRCSSTQYNCFHRKSCCCTINLMFVSAQILFQSTSNFKHIQNIPIWDDLGVLIDSSNKKKSKTKIHSFIENRGRSNNICFSIVGKEMHWFSANTIKPNLNETQGPIHRFRICFEWSNISEYIMIIMIGMIMMMMIAKRIFINFEHIGNAHIVIMSFISINMIVSG